MTPGMIGAHCDGCLYEYETSDPEDLRQFVDKPCPVCNRPGFLTSEEWALVPSIFERIKHHLGSQAPPHLLRKAEVRVQGGKIDIREVSAQSN